MLKKPVFRHGKRIFGGWLWSFRVRRLRMPRLMPILRTASWVLTARRWSKACLILCWSISSRIIPGTTAFLWNTAKPNCVRPTETIHQAKMPTRFCWPAIITVKCGDMPMQMSGRSEVWGIKLSLRPTMMRRDRKFCAGKAVSSCLTARR